MEYDQTITDVCLYILVLYLVILVLGSEFVYNWKLYSNTFLEPSSTYQRG